MDDNDTGRELSHAESTETAGRSHPSRGRAPREAERLPRVRARAIPIAEGRCAVAVLQSWFDRCARGRYDAEHCTELR